jgi:SAM-dependent methyltransferase
MPDQPFRVPPLNAHYEGAYDSRALAWRRLGAAEKARNLRRLLGPGRPESVLEVGCGTGALLATLASAGCGSRHVGVDVADPATHTDPLAAALDLRAYDGHTLPFGDHSFDLVVASHVIEHVPEPRRLLAEMVRVARRWIYVEVPCELHLRTSRRALQQTLDIGHINAYTPESFELLLASSGLAVQHLAVFDHSLALHRFNNRLPSALLKRGLRGGLLALSPRLASRVFTYHCGALVTC